MNPAQGILQARNLEWVAIPFSKASSWPRDQTQVSPIAGRFFTTWASREGFWYGHRVAQSSPQLIVEHSQHPQRKFYPCLQPPLSSFPPPGLDNHQAYFVSMNLPVWTLHINAIIQYVVLYNCTRQYFTPFHCQVIFHCRDRSYFIYLVVSCKTFRACLIFIKSFSVEKFLKNFYWNSWFTMLC